MRSSSRPAPQGCAPSDGVPARRYVHPIPAHCPPPACLIPAEGLQWIYAALYAQSTALEEIRALLQKGNNF